jgi:hypothetical protein
MSQELLDFSNEIDARFEIEDIALILPDEMELVEQVLCYFN